MLVYSGTTNTHCLHHHQTHKKDIVAKSEVIAMIQVDIRLLGNTRVIDICLKMRYEETHKDDYITAVQQGPSRGHQSQILKSTTS